MSEAQATSSTTMAEGVTGRRTEKLRKILRSGLTASFQPIYAVGDSTPFAVEGLIRGPIGSILEEPRQLFHAAQLRGMTLALEQAAYYAVLTSFAALGWPGKLFLNVLPSSLLRSMRLPRDLRRAIADAGLHPSQIVLELTEHDPIPDGTALLRILDPFFDEGMSLSIDDVGAGFANMRLICELQPHFLKVDQFFLAGIGDSLVKQSALRQFIHFAADIGAEIVAEGVEREADAEVALQLGVGFMQGHLFGKPAAKPYLMPRTKTISGAGAAM